MTIDTIPKRGRVVVKAGRKWNAERAEIKLANLKRESYVRQETLRAPRVMPDTRGSLFVALTLAGIGLATSFVVSYSTLVAVAEWMKLPLDFLVFIVPGFLETMILFSAYDFIISRSRGNSGRIPFWFMIGVSVIAVVGNAAHSLAAWQATGEIPWYGWLGTFLSAIVPLVVVYISKRLSVLVFSEPIVL